MEPGNPSSPFQGTAGHEYILSWTITTVCGSSTDEVIIGFSGDSDNCGEISLIGEFNEWVDDHYMTRDTDNPDLWSTQITFSDEDDPNPPFGIVEVKFREDGSWASNWGATDFPAGVGYNNGPNIPVLLNEGEDETEYYVTFNCVTGEYYFDDLADFTCGDYVFDDRDNHVYPTIQIGTRCWFRKNLNVGTRINGALEQADNGDMEKYCYDDSDENCGLSGGLYQWNEAMQYTNDEGSQGICPTGWHIPTDEEVKLLEGTIDSQFPLGDPEWDEVGWRGFDAEGKSKETGTLHWDEPNTGATNESGFTFLPGGSRTFNGFFLNKGNSGYFWTSSESRSSQAWGRQLHYFSKNIGRFGGNIANGFSIRCTRDP